MDKNNKANLHSWFDISMVEMSDTKFNEQFESAIELVNRFGIGKTSMPPIIMAYVRPYLGEESQALGDIGLMVVCVAEDFNEASSKRLICNQIGAKMRHDKLVPVAIFFASEAWVSSRSAEEEISKQFMAPSEDPNRKECFTIVGRALGGDCKAMAMIEVTRDSEDKMRATGKMEKIMDAKLVHAPIVNSIFDGFIDGSIVFNPEFFKEQKG